MKRVGMCLGRTKPENLIAVAEIETVLEFVELFCNAYMCCPK